MLIIKIQPRGTPFFTPQFFHRIAFHQDPTVPQLLWSYGTAKHPLFASLKISLIHSGLVYLL